MSSESLYYCSEASRSANEACFGTGVNADIWLLIEVPEPWGRKAVEESSMPQPVKDHLRSLTQRSKRIRTQLIKQEPRSEWPHRVYIAFTYETSPKIYRCEINSYDELLKLDALLLLEEKIALDHEIIDDPLHLVCTHGRHDKCCAKFGYATYKYMHEIDPGNVWQTSHTGGDRFASNVISFPTGVYYGHVDEPAARAIIDAECRHELYLENYRGRTCYGRYSQIGEYFVRRESGVRSTEELKRNFVRSNEEKTKWTAEFTSVSDGKRYQVIFDQHHSVRKALMTCAANEEKSPVEYHLLAYDVVDTSTVN